MKEAFLAGGWGMYPTLVAGLALILTCLLYAFRPESRFVPLMLSLGLFTLMAGTLGFASGLISMTSYAVGPGSSEVPANILLAGFGESLHNVALALILATLGTLLASVGTLRLALGARAARAALG
ncbi:hypothetical protein JY651_13190 [Pyxidicoccus parkwayensis]|uniref:Uncharacterized protein n=1 Tax=Pyxidicoccus parkwayensis TaxID=2813578 RepID=A0ABX7P5R9_9BACT|nr:hypothetical protein [Pyxidicoccus parkwaysis]QSQ25819.1 hypothetical protein JY651_13190 [Pyxidicoccus parkwaysis]